MRLKLGMVGGGTGAFIGGIHRIAARLDGHWDLVAGAFSSDPARAAQSEPPLRSRDHAQFVQHGGGRLLLSSSSRLPATGGLLLYLRHAAAHGEHLRVRFAVNPFNSVGRQRIVF